MKGKLNRLFYSRKIVKKLIEKIQEQEIVLCKDCVFCVDEICKHIIEENGLITCLGEERGLGGIYIKTSDNFGCVLGVAK